MDEILAAARGKNPAGGAPAPPAAAASKAGPRPNPHQLLPPCPAKVAPGGKGMSMDEILAMARGKKAAAAVTGARPLQHQVLTNPLPKKRPLK